MITNVKVADKELPVCFSMRAINQFCVKHKLTAGESFEMLSARTSGGGGALSLTYSQIADLFYFGLKEGHRKENAKFTLTQDGILDLFDDEPGLLAKVLKLYGESLAKKWAADKGNLQSLQSKEEAKKKSL